MGQAVVIPLPAPVDGLIRLPVGLVGPYRLQAASGHAGRRLLRRNPRCHGPQHRRGAAAALRFDCPKDAQSVELQTKIRTDGAESALALYTGLTPDHPLFGRILDIYRALAVAAKA